MKVADLIRFPTEPEKGHRIPFVSPMGGVEAEVCAPYRAPEKAYLDWKIKWFSGEEKDE